MRRIAALALLAFAACSPQSPGSAATGQPAPGQPAAAAQLPRHPESGLEVIPLTVTMRDGHVHRFTVEVARTASEQARGLMFRKQMGADEGMIFPRDPPDFASFWMKNTVIPLDIVFIGTDRRIINIAADAVPYSLDPRSAQGLTAGVLELNGGRAAELGIAAGDKVEW